MIVRSAIIVLLLFLAGCEEEEGTSSLSITIYSTNVDTGWTFDEAHDIVWDGEDDSTWEVRCSAQEDGLDRIFTFHALDTLYKDGFDLTITIVPFGGNGVYELLPDGQAPPFDLALSTTDQNYDLELRDTGTCSVTIADGERFGDFTCPALIEDVVHEHQPLAFSVTGHWECVEVADSGTDG